METAKFCPKCGHQVQEGETYCPNCGANLMENNMTENGNQVNVDRSGEVDSKSSAGFVLGILSIILLSWLLGVIGIAFTASRRNDNSKAKTGFICSIIGTVLSVIVIICSVLIMVISSATPL